MVNNMDNYLVYFLTLLIFFFIKTTEFNYFTNISINYYEYEKKLD